MRAPKHSGSGSNALAGVDVLAAQGVFTDSSPGAEDIVACAGGFDFLPLSAELGEDAFAGEGVLAGRASDGQERFDRRESKWRGPKRPGHGLPVAVAEAGVGDAVAGFGGIKGQKLKGGDGEEDSAGDTAAVSLGFGSEVAVLALHEGVEAERVAFLILPGAEERGVDCRWAGGPYGGAQLGDLGGEVLRAAGHHERTSDRPIFGGGIGGHSGQKGGAVSGQLIELAAAEEESEVLEGFCAGDSLRCGAGFVHKGSEESGGQGGRVRLGAPESGGVGRGGVPGEAGLGGAGLARGKDECAEAGEEAEGVAAREGVEGVIGHGRRLLQDGALGETRPTLKVCWVMGARCYRFSLAETWWSARRRMASSQARPHQP